MKNCRKIVFVLVSMLVVLLAVTAQADGILEDPNFPDPAFRNALDRMYADGGHYVDFYHIRELHLDSWNITDITGIEFFPNLEELYIGNNRITSLTPLEQCTKLRVLDCMGNPLNVVNMAPFSNLQGLYCSGEQLKVLAIAGSKQTLKNLYISDVGFASLELSGFTVLENFTCGSGGKLTKLTLSGNPLLENLYCSSPLTSLNISSCPKLSRITLDGCRFPSLSISGLEALVNLDCMNNTVPMSDLTVSDCPSLEEMNCENSQVGAIHISGCGELFGLNCANNNLTSLDGIPTLYVLDCSGNRISQLGSCPELLELHCQDNNLTSLSVPENVYILDCSRNRLNALNVSQCPAMEVVLCTDNGLTSLDISGCGVLDWLHAYGNNLTGLEIGGTGLDETQGIIRTVYENRVVMMYGSLFFDTGTTLLKNGTVLYEPDANELPLPTFFLPANLTVIESEAFSGIAAESVYIPGTVETITGDPFAGAHVKYIYGYYFTEAESFANAHADRYTFVPLVQSSH